jgi:hypothetical protein
MDLPYPVTEDLKPVTGHKQLTGFEYVTTLVKGKGQDSASKGGM